MKRGLFGRRGEFRLPRGIMTSRTEDTEDFLVIEVVLCRLLLRRRGFAPSPGGMVRS